jgi:hypothetical protein
MAQSDESSFISVLSVYALHFTPSHSGSEVKTNDPTAGSTLLRTLSRDEVDERGDVSTLMVLPFDFPASIESGGEIRESISGFS